MTLEEALNALDNTTDRITYYEAVQFLINNGTGWLMEGHVGRSMSRAVQAGYCMLGTARHKDFYGNTIPSRTDVPCDSAGSFMYVKVSKGIEWAQKMEEIS